jgi:hypothetical protein
LTLITRRMCRLCPRMCSQPFHRTGLVILSSRRIRRLASCDPLYPAVAIFAMNRVEDPINPLRSNAAERALIARPDMEVSVRRLPPGGAAFLKTLIDGGTLGAAAATAFAETPSFDLPANIAGMIEAAPAVMRQPDRISHAPPP